MKRRNFLYSALSVAAVRKSLFPRAVPEMLREPPFLAQSASLNADAALATAMDAVQKAIPIAEQDPDRPVYHFRPPAQWTNDPNAPFFYKGWYHLFYQLNPFEPRIGHQHWGHARTKDLVNWEHLPIALWPSADLGERAIFSGGAAFAADGLPRVVYTSIGHEQPEQWLAIPVDADLLKWQKYVKNPVLSQAAHRSGPIAQWRDPFMFRKDGTLYMVCGGGTPGGRGQVQLYRSANGNLTEWTHLGVIFQSLDRDVRNFECPNLFPLDGRWVLIVSPNQACEYWIGDLDINRMKFEPTAHGILDVGDSYASNIQVDPQGRTILWLWGRTNTAQGKGWNGVMTMPRIVSIGSDGFLMQQPAPEFETLRDSAITIPGRNLEAPSVLEGIATDCCEIEATFSGDGTFGLELRRSNSGERALVVSIEKGRMGAFLNVGKRRAFVGTAERYQLRVFLDKRCIEVFVNNGVTALYNWFDAAADDTRVAVFGQTSNSPRSGTLPAGVPAPPSPIPPRLESLKLWPMKKASFSLEFFHV